MLLWVRALCRVRRLTDSGSRGRSGTRRSVLALSTRPWSLKIEPSCVSAQTPARDGGFWDVHHGSLLPSSGAASRRQLQNQTKPERRHEQRGHATGCGGSFFSAEASAPVQQQQTDLHTDQRATDSSTGGLGLGRSYSLFGQATETVDVYSNWVLVFLGLDGVTDLTDPFSPADVG